MTMRRALFALLLVASFGAVAAGRYVPISKRLTPEQIASTGMTRQQLEQLDALLEAADARDAATRTTSSVEADVAKASTAPMQYIGLDNAPIAAKVRGSVSGWSAGTVFELDNGQQWKVLKGTVKLSHAIDSPSVRLVPGVAGRWFFELDEDHPKARVYRID
ncbi:hypothetical protein [Lysobacter sp. HA35]